MSRSRSGQQLPLHTNEEEEARDTSMKRWAPYHLLTQRSANFVSRSGHVRLSEVKLKKKFLEAKKYLSVFHDELNGDIFTFISS